MQFDATDRLLHSALSHRNAPRHAAYHLSSAMPPQRPLNEESEPLLPSSNNHNVDRITSSRIERDLALRDETTFSEIENEIAIENEQGDGSLAPPPRNVALVLLYTWVAFTGRGLWNQNCLATLVFLLRNGDAKAIGFLTAAMGIAQLSTSIPTGILADRYRRDTLLKAGALIGIAASGVSISAALRPRYAMLLLALILWGIHWGIVNTSIIALFSDSIPDGERSYYFTKRAVLINFANTCGPAIALVMFAVMGNNWTVKDCSMVLLAGNIVSLPGLLLLCWMSDDNDNDDDSSLDDETPSPPNDDERIFCVGGDNKNALSRPRERITTTALPSSNDNNLEEPLLPVVAAVSGTVSANARLDGTRNRQTTAPYRVSVVSTADTHRDETYDEARLGQALSWCCLLRKKRIVPSLIATADIVGGFASGMSIRYIAIFLYDNLHLSPIAVQVVYIANPILQVFLRKQAQILAGTHGRCKVTVGLKWIGISLMIAMVVLYKLGAPRIVVCVVLILRTCFMNSPSSLTKSVLMDHVPKEDRGKWASLESVSMVSWSGSAALGGLLVESRGILFNFCFTAFLQFLATGPLLLLSFFDDRKTSNDDDNDNDNDNDDNNGIEDEDEPRTTLALNNDRSDAILETEDNYEEE